LLAAFVPLCAGCHSPTSTTAVPQTKASTQPASTAISFTDDLGHAVSLAKPAQRVVSLSPNLTESMFAIGADDLLVGVTEFCKYPPEAQSKPHIGGIINPVLEKVLAAKPDLVLGARGNPDQFLKRLVDMKVTVASFDPQTLDAAIDLLRKLGGLCGRERKASQVADALSARAVSIRAQAVKPATPPKALFILEWQPLFVAGPKSFVDDMIRAGGGVNVVKGENIAAGANADSPWPQVSAEKMIALDPDIIIFAKAQGAGVDTSGIISRMKSDAAWKNVSAIRANHIYAVDDDLVTIPGPRLVDGLAEVVRIIGEAPAASPQR
jgi:iron complex transport system substrate-binding protein